MPRRTARIFLVGHDADLQDVLADYLAGAGYAVTPDASELPREPGTAAIVLSQDELRRQDLLAGRPAPTIVLLDMDDPSPATPTSSSRWLRKPVSLKVIAATLAELGVQPGPTARLAGRSV